MKYVSTRGTSEPRPFLDTLFTGLADDGGLFVPELTPRFFPDTELAGLRGLSYHEVAYHVLHKLMPDVPVTELWRMTSRAYDEAAFGGSIASLVTIDEADELFLLKLSEGPTFSFKDFGLRLLAELFEYDLARRKETLTIVGATSGDTGSAAEYALAGRGNIRVVMLSPAEGGMSEFQRAQMYSLDAPNIVNLAVNAPFAKCQEIVKAIFMDAAFKKRYKISAINSINWARIAAQAVYYIFAYVTLAEKIGATSIQFAVPSGNLGDLYAGWFARRMGVPIERLILATNENNMLAELFRTGVYDVRRETVSTTSPSMDITEASNLERLMYDLCGPNIVRALWGMLRAGGSFNISGLRHHRKLTSSGIVAGTSTGTDRLETIRRMRNEHKILIDPHTADGVRVGRALRISDVPLVCLETAHPVKFDGVMLDAVRETAARPEALEDLEERPRHFIRIEPDVDAVRRVIQEVRPDL